MFIIKCLLIIKKKNTRKKNYIKIKLNYKTILHEESKLFIIICLCILMACNSLRHMFVTSSPLQQQPILSINSKAVVKI